MEPLELIDKLAKFIPSPKLHRRTYHGIFASKSKVRSKLVEAVIQEEERHRISSIDETTEKTKKVHLSWSKLIARIYEVNPLICACGEEMRIVAFVTHTQEINRILRGLGWPIDTPSLDPPCEEWDVCQLAATEDGFPDEEGGEYLEVGPDPPYEDDYIDPPHYEEPIYKIMS